MSKYEENSNRLVEGESGTPLGYYLSTFFHPAISLEKKHGYEFATSLAEYLEIDSISAESNGWHMSSERDGVSIEIGKSHIMLSGEKPAGGKSQEWYEHRYHDVLNRFTEKFKPQIALASKAMVRSLFEIDGDARDFLAQHVMNIEPGRFGPLQRPIQLLGMRIAFPPFIRQLKEVGEDGETTNSETTDWLLELKVESWAEDPRMLFVEADASWQEPLSWESDDLIEKVVGRLGELTSYLSNVRDFLNSANGDYDEHD